MQMTPKSPVPIVGPGELCVSFQPSSLQVSPPVGRYRALEVLEEGAAAAVAATHTDQMREGPEALRSPGHQEICVVLLCKALSRQRQML